MTKAMAILIAMDPNKAADVLTGASCTTSLWCGLSNLQEFEPVNECCCACAEMGSSQAASKLILMEVDARNSIIKSMAPRAAANTLTSMEDAMQAICAASEPGSPEVRGLCCAAHAAVVGCADPTRVVRALMAVAVLAGTGTSAGLQARVQPCWQRSYEKRNTAGQSA